MQNVQIHGGSVTLGDFLHPDADSWHDHVATGEVQERKQVWHGIYHFPFSDLDNATLPRSQGCPMYELNSRIRALLINRDNVLDEGELALVADGSTAMGMSTLQDIDTWSASNSICSNR